MSTIICPGCGHVVTKENLKNLKRIEGNLFIADRHCGECGAYLNAKRFVTVESPLDEEKAECDVPGDRIIGSVKQVDGCTILSGAECVSCTSHETRKCQTFSRDLCDAFVCQKCCLKCDCRDSCNSPAWINEGEEHHCPNNKACQNGACTCGSKHS
jgi:hypothetical protein